MSHRGHTVAIVGHSYVRRLRDSSFANMEYNDNQVVSFYFGQGGATLMSHCGVRSIEYQLNRSLSVQPNVIFIHIGENDIGHLHPIAIANKIIRLIEYLLYECMVPFVVVGQLLDWPLQTRPQDIVAANNAIKTYLAALPPHRVKYWRHRGFWRRFNRHLLFHNDSVHLSTMGLERYSRSIRASINYALRHNNY